MRLLLIEQTKQQQTFEHMIHIDNQYVKRTLVFTAYNYIRDLLARLYCGLGVFYYESIWIPRVRNGLSIDFIVT